MVLNLVLQTAAKVIDHDLGNTMATSDVASCGDLELPKVWPAVCVIHSHTVVSETEDDGKEETTQHVGKHHICDDLRKNSWSR